MNRGARWQQRVDDVYDAAMALGAELRRRHAAGEHIGEGVRAWRALLAEYNRLHGAGEPTPAAPGPG